MAWVLFWQLIILMVLGTLLSLIIIQAFKPPHKKEDH
jgi:hypothetical protein